MRDLARITIALLLSVVITGCTKEDPIPEERDPIFKDLEKRKAEHAKMQEDAQAKLIELREKLEKAEPNTIEKKDIEKELAKFRAQLLDHDQWSRYYRIRAERRRLVDRLAYKEAFAAKKEWPDPREYSDYLVNRRLVESSRNWATRVPRLQDRLKGQTAAAEKPKEEKPKGH